MKKSGIRKALNSVTTVLVVMVVLLAVALVGVRIVGIRTYAVISGSMEPVYPTGSLLYVKPVKTEELKVGDTITFMLDEKTVATHRIIEVIPDEEEPGVIRFRTKGDANETPDGAPVHCRNVIGKPLFAIPYLGYFANFVQNPPGLYLAIGAAAILVIMVFLPSFSLFIYQAFHRNALHTLLPAPRGTSDEQRQSDAWHVPAASVPAAVPHHIL